MNRKLQIEPVGYVSSISETSGQRTSLRFFLGLSVVLYMMGMNP